MNRAMRSGVCGIALCVAVGAACAQGEPEQAPAAALLTFVTAVERSTHDPSYRKQAFEQLDARSQAELEKRAALARSLAGRELEGWEMLVPGRLRVSARELRRQRLRADIQGDHATIELSEGQAIDLVREDGHWRVQLFE